MSDLEPRIGSFRDRLKLNVYSNLISTSIAQEKHFSRTSLTTLKKRALDYLRRARPCLNVAGTAKVTIPFASSPRENEVRVLMRCKGTGDAQ